MRESQHRAQKQASYALPLGPLVDGESREPEDRQRVLRQALALGGRQSGRRYLGSGHRREPGDEPILAHGYVGRADVVPELVLARVAEEEAVKIDLARAKARAVVVRLETPNVERHGRSQDSPLTGLPAIRSRSALLGLRGFLTRSDTFSKDSDVSTSRGGMTMSAGSSRSA